VVGVDVIEMRFLEAEGVFLLLDLLQECPASIRPPILGILVDLAEKHLVIDHLTSWRGGDWGHPLSKLLCQIWREEELKIGASRDEFGAILDVAAPLAGVMQRHLRTANGDQLVQNDAETISPPQLVGSSPSCAILETVENLRAKIFILMGKIGFETDWDHPLIDVEDRITISIIKSYLELKMCEVWTEAESELRAEGVETFLCGDDEIAESIRRGADDFAIRLQQNARQFVAQNHQVEEEKESRFYDWLHANHRQTENACKRRKEFFERTSNHHKLAKAKKMQDKLVAESRIRQPYREGDTFHETAINDLNVTEFIGRHVYIDPRRSSLPSIGKTNCPMKKL